MCNMSDNVISLNNARNSFKIKYFYKDKYRKSLKDNTLIEMILSVVINYFFKIKVI